MERKVKIMSLSEKILKLVVEFETNVKNERLRVNNSEGKRGVEPSRIPEYKSALKSKIMDVIDETTV